MSSDPLVMPFGAAVAAPELNGGKLAEESHEAVRLKASDAFGTQRSLQFESLESETRLWDLVGRLVEISGDDSSVRSQVVIEWSQKNSRKVPEPGNLQSIKWMYTKNRSTSGGPNSVVSDLDLDAPLRQARPISEEDAKADETFFRYIFESLLCGDKERVEHVCADTNNWIVRAAISVPQQPSSFIDACRQLSNDSAIGKWEAAVYGSISHNSKVVTPSCDSWEKSLLVHLQANASSQTFEAAVQKDHKLMLQHQNWIRQIASALIEQRVPDLIEQLTSELLNGQQNNQRVGNNNVNNAANSSSNSNINNNGENDREFGETATLIAQPWLARILLHSQLVMNADKSNEQLAKQSAQTTSTSFFGHDGSDINYVNTTITQVYIEYLCDNSEDLDERLEIVPEYVRFLSTAAQTQVYGHVLAQITDRETQQKQVQLARKYSIDLTPVLEHAVASNFELATAVHVEATMSTIDPDLKDTSAFESNLMASNVRLVGASYWLVVAELWPTAVSALSRAYIIFYAQNRRAGAVSLTSTISTDYVRTRAQDGVRSKLQDYPDLVSESTYLRQCSQLAEASASLDAWHALDKSTPGWRSSAAKVVGNAIDSVASALSFGSTQIAAAGSTTQEELLLIRNKYVPMIVYESLDVLSEAQTVSKGYANVALESAVKLADDQSKSYESFDASSSSVLAKPALSL